MEISRHLTLLNGRKTGGTNGGIKNKEIILKIMESDLNITREEIAGQSKVSLRNVDRVIAELKKENQIKRTGSKKTGSWKILK